MTSCSSKHNGERPLTMADISGQVRSINEQHYKRLAMGMFEWRGIDDRGARRIESLMYSMGRCTLFMNTDENGEDYPAVGMIAESGIKFDVYGRPLKWKAVCDNGYTKELDRETAAIITASDGNNVTVSTRSEIERALYFLNEAEAAYKIDLWKHSMPMIVESDAKLDSAKNPIDSMIQKARGAHKVALVIERGMASTASSVLEPSSGSIKERFLIDRDYWDAVIKSILGIPYVAVEKKAPLVVDEAAGGAAEIEIIRGLRLSWRIAGCDDFNRTHDLDEVSCKLRSTPDRFHQDQSDNKTGSLDDPNNEEGEDHE